MFEKVLIANRGEIACRVIKTLRKMGIASVAVYSDADANLLHVSLADEAVHIGPAPSRESYLVAEKIIEVALQTGAQAIHPGYGFLSENSDFCRLCEKSGISFIGPPTGAIEAMGSKSAAKSIMETAGVPLLPGYHGDAQDTEMLKKAAADVGYPVLLKAVAGGGGKGMRIVNSAGEFDDALVTAKREAFSSFGNDDMLVEKYLTQPRHVELQVFCDQQGNGVYLFERDCSVQRRHQKIIEEAPAPKMTEALRIEMGEAAINAAKAIHYVGAGTVEFLLDEDGSFYFMEMNTRLQVEHPVTEMITGLDLVEWQLRVAAGEELPLAQDQLRIHGHAFEGRIYAEDPERDFLPVTGNLSYLQPPEESAHVRVDTGVVQGDDVSIYYDPMIAKLIVWDEDRDRALARLRRALSEYRISGVSTNLGFLYNLASSPAFINADLETGFIDKYQSELFLEADENHEEYLPLASLYLLLRREQIIRGFADKDEDPHSPWNSVSGWRLNEPSLHSGAIVVNGQQFDVPVEEIGAGDRRTFKMGIGHRTVLASGSLKGNELFANIDGHRQRVFMVDHGNDRYGMFTPKGAFQFELAQPDYGDEEDAASEGSFKAPMNGKIIEVSVQAGDSVSKGQTLVIMEAMKMEHAILAPSDGVVEELFCAADELVEDGKELLRFVPDNADDSSKGE